MSEIVLKQPTDGVLWSWHTTRKSDGDGGAGVSNYTQFVTNFNFVIINLEMYFKTKFKYIKETGHFDS